MAEQTKKSKYNFGGHELDAKLYLQNIRDNAETFLNSKTDWTPEQKEEWKHAYTNFTNALQEDINNGGGRFSTDEFGTITDTKGEFSNTDSDNYYYNNKGQQISQEDYDALKKRKQGKYQTFEANRQFASYANQIGKGLREALAAKNKTSDDTNGFDYAKNGFDAYWQKKYNPAGTVNDLQPYWNKDKEGEYTNRVAETIADLDDYMSKQEMSDDVKAAYTNYRNILGQYNPSDKNFNLDTWKNNMILAANRAGISKWNNGYFNIGSQGTTSTEDKKPEAFDINNDQAVIDKYKLADQIAAHPEQREHLLDLARRQYNQESQDITDQYNTAIKQDAKNNKIWEQYLLNNPYIGDVNKRVGRTGTTSFWSGAKSTKKQQQAKATISKQTAQDKGRTAQQQKNMEQTGFTGTDIARLASIGMDMGSLAAAYTGPETMGVGTLVSAGLGVGSTATNFIADLVDGENTWEALKTAGYGLGMDTLGLIPGAGTAGKLGKIGKTAVKYVPRILAYLGTLQGVQNMPYIVNSFKKLGTNQKLTVDDYRNMAQGISLITGIGAAGSRKIRNNKTTQQLGKQKVDFSKLKNKSIQVKQSDQVALRFKDKQGNTKSFVFKGDDANAIKNAKNNEEIKAITSKYSKLRNYELVSSKALRPHLQWIRKDGNWQNPLHRVNNPIRKYDVYENAGGMYTNQQGIRGWFMPYGGDKISKSNILGVPGKTKQVKADTDIIKQQVQNAVNERAANENLLKDFQAASDMRRQAKNSGNIKDYHDATTLQKEAWNKLQGARTEYNKLRSMVKKGSITFSNGQNKVQADWKDILAKYRIAYKEGGSIQKLASGNSINGNPWFSTLEGKKVSNPDTDFPASIDMSKLVSIDGKTGNIIDATVSNTPGTVDTRYQAAAGNTLENTRAIESHPYYQWFDTQLYNNHKITPVGTAWQDAADLNIPKGSKASFKDENGNYRTSWTNTNNDIYGNPGQTYNTDEAYTHGVRYDGINGARHSVFLNRGTRYFYKDTEGNKQYVNLSDADKKNYSISKEPVWSGWSNDKHTWWDDYEITGANSQVNPAEDNKDKPGFKFNNPINKQLIIDMMDQIRVNNAINANNKIAATLKQSPILYDPQEDHRYIQSDLDAEMNGQQVAAQLARIASHPITSDGNLQSMLQLEAAAKGNEAITAGRQQSNQRLREMQEQAWQQELVNHTGRHDIAMKNRESLYNTINYNKQIDATNINANYTVQDARAQEAILPYKQDQEIRRAEQKSWRDRLAMKQINDSLRLSLGKYASSYNLSPDDVQLWEDVYVNGSKTLDDIKKNPVLTKRWNNIKYTVGQIQNDLIGDYYGVPRSKYWTIRQSTPSYSYSTEVKKAKKGAKLNLRKVREAAKGEKLAAAQLKAQTADADRFYKTTKDHIDRMYAAISRTMNYSSTKKKRKKKKNYDI